MDFRQEIISQPQKISLKEGLSFSDKTTAPQSFYLISKRIADILISLLLILLLLPLLLIITLVLKISEPGSGAVFKQKRLGCRYKEFQIYKFRTMIPDAENLLKQNKILYEEYLNNNYKLPEKKDYRITPFGRFLRKTSLDELPQLFNVLKGEMSLVGPRPVIPDEIKLYREFSDKLLSVKPGITGWWQISGRANIDYPDRVFLDIFYIENASFKFDLKILINTLPSVFSGRGAH